MWNDYSVQMLYRILFMCEIKAMLDLTNIRFSYMFFVNFFLDELMF